MSVTLCRNAQRQLRSIGYPSVSATYSAQNVKELVIWLEENIFRVYDERQRRPLQSSNTDDTSWLKALSNYLRQIGVARAIPVGGRATALLWFEPDKQQFRNFAITRLILLAVSDKYAELDGTNKILVSTGTNLGENPATESDGDPLQKEAINMPTVVAKVDGMLKLMKMPSFSESSTQQRAPEVVSALNAISAVISSAGDNNNAAPQPLIMLRDENMDSYPVAFKLPDGVKHIGFLRRFISLLRLLQVERLTEIQSEINATLAGLQAVTARPITDPSRGRVGR